jgi:hypothetical protein
MMRDEVDYGLSERAWEAYRSADPRPKVFPRGVRKFHSIQDSKADRDRRLIEWFLSVRQADKPSEGES